MFVARFLTALLLAIAASPALADEGDVAAKAQAVLREHCLKCHGAKDDPSADLNVMDRGVLLNAERKLVVPLKPDASELVKRIEEKDEDNRMPPTPEAALSMGDRQALRAWIMAGAPEFTAQTQTVQKQTAEKATQPAPPAQPNTETAKPAMPAVDAPALAAQAKEILRSHCWDCHGGSKTNAGLKILDHDLLVATKHKVVPGNPDASPLFQLLMSTTGSVMPPAGQPRLMNEDIEIIRRWIVAGAVPFPKDVAAPTEDKKDPALANVVGIDYVLKKILEHRRSLTSDARPFVRYFSVHHLLSGGATREELDLQRDALAKTINHLSTEREIVKLEAIDAPINSVFAIDIRKVGWHKQPFDRMVDGKSAGKSKLNIFDLALLDYPYGIVYEDSEIWDRLVEEFFIPANLARPIPFVRADWFCSIATQPPLYEDFLRLPMTLDALEKRIGVHADEDVKSGIAKRAGMTVSGVSRNNRVVERHSTNTGSYWKSFDFASSKGPQSMFHDPVNMKPAGGEMIFTLPNGLQGYFITTGDGKRLERAPTDIVTDKFAENKTVVNGLSCIRCHDAGIKPFADNVRMAIERLPGSPGFDKRHALELYIKHDDMDKLVDEDTRRFTQALIATLGKPQVREPLAPVSQRFLDAPLQLTTVSAELGLPNSMGLEQLFRSPQFSGLGMAPLTSSGAIRRDTWEDYFDQIVRMLGLGVPVVPIDGLGRLDYPPVTPGVDVELTTNKKNNVFAPGDELVIFVNNRGAKPINIELVGTSADGAKVILAPHTTKVASGEQYRFPATGGIKIQSGLGKELVTVLAGDSEFPAGEVLRAEGVVDRVYHPFYQLTEGDRRGRIGFDPSKLVKKTLVIDTQ